MTQNKIILLAIASLALGLAAGCSGSSEPENTSPKAGTQGRVVPVVRPTTVKPAQPVTKAAPTKASTKPKLDSKSSATKSVDTRSGPANGQTPSPATTTPSGQDVQPKVTQTATVHDPKQPKGRSTKSARDPLAYLDASEQELKEMFGAVCGYPWPTATGCASAPSGETEPSSPTNDEVLWNKLFRIATQFAVGSDGQQIRARLERGFEQIAVVFPEEEAAPASNARTDKCVESWSISGACKKLCVHLQNHKEGERNICIGSCIKGLRTMPWSSVKKLLDLKTVRAEQDLKSAMITASMEQNQSVERVAKNKALCTLLAKKDVDFQRVFNDPFLLTCEEFSSIASDEALSNLEFCTLGQMNNYAQCVANATCILL